MADRADSVKSELTTMEKQPDVAGVKTAEMGKEGCVGMLDNTYSS